MPRGGVPVRRVPVAERVAGYKSLVLPVLCIVVPLAPPLAVALCVPRVAPVVERPVVVALPYGPVPPAARIELVGLGLPVLFPWVPPPGPLRALLLFLVGLPKVVLLRLPVKVGGQ